MKERDFIATVTAFARELRAVGVTADQTRLRAALVALDLLDVNRTEDVYWALRLTLCATPDDLSRFDVVFDRHFRAPSFGSTTPREELLRRSNVGRPVRPDRPAASADDGNDAQPVAATDVDLLRNRDVTELNSLEHQEINRMISLLQPRSGNQLTRRRVPGRDRVDVRRTVRTMLRAGGEPAALKRTRRRRQPRRIVILIDVSGSMTPYAELLLRFGHASAHVAARRTEVFTLGTRMTRVTRPLQLRDPDIALQRAGAAVPDWSGGTRLGESLRAFLDHWGQRGTARGAVVVIGSDGWETGDGDLLGAQMARLARLAHRVVWVNPHRGKSGFAPLTTGMIAALPSVDDLVAGHSFQSIADLVKVIADA